MSDFDFLDSYTVDKTSTARFALPEDIFGEGAALTVAPATTTNEDYMHAVLKLSSKGTVRAATRGHITPAMVKENNDLDRVVFGQLIIKGWECLNDRKGGEIKYTPKRAEELVKKLPDWVFQEVKAFCQDHGNFLPDEPIDVGELAGN